MNPKLPRVETILDAGSWDGPAADTVVLDYDDRFRRRIVLEGQGGTRLLLDLGEPRLLHDGDGLKLDDGRTVVVAAASEKLAEITCADTGELVRVAWHLGNRHLPTQLLAGKLRIRKDHVIIDMVKRLGARVELIDAPFEPEGGAYGHGKVTGHDHGHSHSHDHGHGHGSHGHG